MEQVFGILHCSRSIQLHEPLEAPYARWNHDQDTLTTEPGDVPTEEFLTRPFRLRQPEPQPDTDCEKYYRADHAEQHRCSMHLPPSIERITAPSDKEPRRNCTEWQAHHSPRRRAKLGWIPVASLPNDHRNQQINEMPRRIRQCNRALLKEPAACNAIRGTALAGIAISSCPD